jgi:hypothetical protein
MIIDPKELVKDIEKEMDFTIDAPALHRELRKHMNVFLYKELDVMGHRFIESAPHRQSQMYKLGLIMLQLHYQHHGQVDRKG